MRSRNRDERGVTAVLVAVLMSAVLLVSAAFAVDLGQQRVVRRDMQAIADVVALDLVRLLNGSKASDYDKSAFDAAKDQSVARNDKALGGKLAASDVTWDFVQRSGSDWVVIPKTAEDAPTAIRVSAKSDTTFAFGGVTGAARGGSTRTAVAQAESYACIGIGSYAAALDSSGSSILGPLLGDALNSAVDLQAIGYNGLASADISLLDLLHAPGITAVGTDNLADIEPVTLSQLMIASAAVLRQNGDTAEAKILYDPGPPPSGLATKIGPQLNNVNIGDIIEISQGAGSALGTNLNAFDLITSAIFLANGDNAIAINGLGINLPLLGSITGGVKIIQKPQESCTGVGSHVTTSQIQIKPLTATLTGLPPITIPGLTSISLLGTQQVILDVDAAKARATITDVACDPDVVTARVRADLTSISLSTKLEVKAKVSLGALGIVDLVLPYSIVATPTEDDAVGVTKAMPVPPFDKLYPVGSGSIALDPSVSAIYDSAGFKATLLGVPIANVPLVGPVLVSTLNGVLGGLLPNVLTAVTNIAHDLTEGIDQFLLGPLQDMLGLTIAGSDVYVPGDKAPECGYPKLVG